MEIKVETTDITLAGTYTLFVRFKQLGEDPSVQGTDYQDVSFTLNLQKCLETWLFPTPSSDNMNNNVFEIIEEASLEIDWEVADNDYRTCHFNSSVSVVDSQGVLYDSIVVSHT